MSQVDPNTIQDLDRLECLCGGANDGQRDTTNCEHEECIPHGECAFPCKCNQVVLCNLPQDRNVRQAWFNDRWLPFFEDHLVPMVARQHTTEAQIEASKYLLAACQNYCAGFIKAEPANDVDGKLRSFYKDCTTMDPLTFKWGSNERMTLSKELILHTWVGLEMFLTVSRERNSRNRSRSRSSSLSTTTNANL